MSDFTLFLPVLHFTMNSTGISRSSSLSPPVLSVSVTADVLWISSMKKRCHRLLQVMTVRLDHSHSTSINTSTYQWSRLQCCPNQPAAATVPLDGTAWLVLHLTHTSGYGPATAHVASDRLLRPWHACSYCDGGKTTDYGWEVGVESSSPRQSCGGNRWSLPLVWGHCSHHAETPTVG